MSATRPIVLLGMMAKVPVPGVIWQTVHYLLGLRRLGFDPYYVEAHARTPAMLMATATDDGPALAAGLINQILRRFGLGDRWAYHDVEGTRACYGMSERALLRLYGDAELLLNLHGGTRPRPEHVETGRLVYLETDPVQLQVQLHDGVASTHAFLESHAALFTFAENLGRPDCELPVDERFRFVGTRSPWCSTSGRAAVRRSPRCSRQSATGGSRGARSSIAASGSRGARMSSGGSSLICRGGPDSSSSSP